MLCGLQLPCNSSAPKTVRLLDTLGFGQSVKSGRSLNNPEPLIWILHWKPCRSRLSPLKPGSLEKLVPSFLEVLDKTALMWEERFGVVRDPGEMRQLCADEARLTRYERAIFGWLFWDCLG